jgi:hypothetical protein
MRDVARRQVRVVIMFPLTYFLSPWGEEIKIYFFGDFLVLFGQETARHMDQSD